MAPVTPPSDADLQKRILDTTRELEALIAKAPGREPDPDSEAFQSFVNLHEFPDEVQVGLLSEFIELVLPEMGRSAQPLRTMFLHNRDIPPEEIEALNGWLGVVPARLRQLEWLDEPGILLAGDSPLRGTHAAKEGESGVSLGRVLCALTNGRLALIHVVGTWTNPHRIARTVTTIADARLVEPWEALQEFHLYEMLRSLRSCLWGKVPSPGEPPRVADIETRRARFTTLVSGLAHAAQAHAQELRRVGDEPA